MLLGAFVFWCSGSAAQAVVIVVTSHSSSTTQQVGGSHSFGPLIRMPIVTVTANNIAPLPRGAELRNAVVAMLLYPLSRSTPNPDPETARPKPQPLRGNRRDA